MTAAAAVAAVATFSAPDQFLAPKVELFAAACARLGLRYRPFLLGPSAPPPGAAVERLRSPADLDALAASGAVDVAFPLDDSTVTAAHRFNRDRGRLPMGPGLPALVDKWQFYQACASLGLPTAHTVRVDAPGDVDRYDRPGPVVLKPAQGTGSRFVYAFESVAELKAAWPPERLGELLTRARALGADELWGGARAADRPLMIVQEYLNVRRHYTVYAATVGGVLRPVTWSLAWDHPPPSCKSYAYAAPSPPEPAVAAAALGALQRLVDRLEIRWMWGTHELIEAEDGRVVVTDPNPRLCGWREVLMLGLAGRCNYLELLLRETLAAPNGPPPAFPEFACLHAFLAPRGRVKALAPAPLDDVPVASLPGPGAEVRPDADLGEVDESVIATSPRGAEDAYARARRFLRETRVDYA
jgi:hypothetical protein